MRSTKTIIILIVIIILILIIYNQHQSEFVDTNNKTLNKYEYQSNLEQSSYSHNSHDNYTKDNINDNLTKLHNSIIIPSTSNNTDIYSYANPNTTFANQVTMIKPSNTNPLELKSSTEVSNTTNMQENNNESQKNGNDSNKILKTYFNLENEFTENGNQFKCPPETPIAVSYILKNNAKIDTINGDIYRNACKFSGGHRAFNDLLYGDAQQINDFADARDLSAFIPYNVSEGCKDNKLTVPLEINLSQIKTEPIYDTSKSEPYIAGFKQNKSSSIVADCNKYCNSMLDSLCINLPSSYGYCGQIIIASYYKKSIYLARNIPENFCSCEILGAYILEGKTIPYSYTHAVDINEVINYKNPITSVTCSN